MKTTSFIAHSLRGLSCTHGFSHPRPVHEAWARTLVLSALAWLSLGQSLALAELSTGTVAVYSCMSPGYVRTTLPDGTIKPETYSFGEGGDWGGPMKDDTIDKLRFLDIARTIAPSLATQNYLPSTSKDPSKTELLLMVYWGTTSGSADAPDQMYKNAQALIPPPLHRPKELDEPDQSLASKMNPGKSMAGSSEVQQYFVQKMINDSALNASWTMTNIANSERDKRNMDNASVLGYLPDYKRLSGLKGTALANLLQDVINDVEENRYFVVILAYDFQLLWKKKQRKLLWETRFNIRQRGHDFGQDLPIMAKFASKFYGKDSEGLIRKSFTDAKVTVGETKFLGFESEQKK